MGAEEVPAFKVMTATRLDNHLQDKQHKGHYSQPREEVGVLLICVGGQVGALQLVKLVNELILSRVGVVDMYVGAISSLGYQVISSGGVASSTTVNS